MLSCFGSCTTQCWNDADKCHASKTNQSKEAHLDLFSTSLSPSKGAFHHCRCSLQFSDQVYFPVKYPLTFWWVQWKLDFLRYMLLICLGYCSECYSFCLASVKTIVLFPFSVQQAVEPEHIMSENKAFYTRNQITWRQNHLILLSSPIAPLQIRNGHLALQGS